MAAAWPPFCNLGPPETPFSAFFPGSRGARVSYRSFYASDGRRWEVWLILPTAAERRAEGRRSHAGGARVPERRVSRDRRRGSWQRTVVHPEFEKGWLCFETEGEKRRLAPVPKGWNDAGIEQLQDLLTRANLVP